MDIDQTQFVAGGYFILKSVPRLEWMAADLLPERIISLSGCICPSVHVYWAWGAQEAIDFGIPQAKLPDTHQWTDVIDYPNVFSSLEDSRRFVQMFLDGQPSLHMIGIGLPATLVDNFLTLKQRVYDTRTGKYREEVYSVSKMIQAGQPPATDGLPLGFEVLSYDSQLGHSWLCSGLERDMADQFGIRPNEHGLIATLDEAMQVYEWIAEDEQRGHRAEPEPYYPWLLVEYPISNSQSLEAPDER